MTSPGGGFAFDNITSPSTSRSGAGGAFPLRTPNSTRDGKSGAADVRIYVY